jgi:hypothetical protein
MGAPPNSYLHSTSVDLVMNTLPPTTVPHFGFICTFCTPHPLAYSLFWVTPFSLPVIFQLQTCPSLGPLLCPSSVLSPLPPFPLLRL